MKSGKRLPCPEEKVRHGQTGHYRLAFCTVWMNEWMKKRERDVSTVLDRRKVVFLRCFKPDTSKRNDADHYAICPNSPFLSLSHTHTHTLFIYPFTPNKMEAKSCSPNLQLDIIYIINTARNPSTNEFMHSAFICEFVSSTFHWLQPWYLLAVIALTRELFFCWFFFFTFTFWSPVQDKKAKERWKLQPNIYIFFLKSFYILPINDY